MVGTYHWFTKARIFCAPNVTAETGETEGLPITVLEAQAMALPVVSTIHSGIPEAVRHDHTGLLAREHNADGLAYATLGLLADTGRCRRLGVDPERVPTLTPRESR
jgi:glycosyltransferase involved in cell wall biosynthesis